MRDFTRIPFTGLLNELKGAGYQAAPFVDWMNGGEREESSSLVLRHDVDRLPWNSVRTAELEAERGMVGSYYFRVVKGAWDPKAIRAIGELGHECGYHYEDLDLAHGNHGKALELFERHLEQLREIVPVHTICMHGSPMSKWDNRDLWRGMAEGGGRRTEAGEQGEEKTKNEKPGTKNYRSYGIIGEPYFDIDFSKVGYITDTGRSWNNREASIRDKVDSPFGFRFRNTFELIDAIREGKMPKKLMITIHPQRWNDAWIPWTTELVGQSMKNVVKRFLVSRRSRG